MLKVLPRTTAASALSGTSRWERLRQAVFLSETERTRAALQVTWETADGKHFERVAVSPTYTG